MRACSPPDFPPTTGRKGSPRSSKSGRRTSPASDPRVSRLTYNDRGDEKMVFDLTEEQRMIQDTAREFARKEVLPKAAELDGNSRVPGELVRQMAELGFMGI